MTTTSFTALVSSGLNNPYGLAFDQTGNLFVSNFGGNTISAIDSTGAIVNTITSGLFNQPVGLAFDALGNLYVANFDSSTISQITPEGIVTTFCSTDLNGPHCLAFDQTGNLYVSNFNDNTIAVIDPSGGSSIFSTDSSLSGPTGVAFDASGNLLVSNFTGSTISILNSTGALVNTITSGLLNGPIGTTFDNYGNLYVANNRGSNVLEILSDYTSVSVVSSLSNAPRFPAFSSTSFLYVSAFTTTIYKSNDAICFNEGTKILSLNAELKEEYIPIELLKKGDFVKTYLHGYRKIDIIGKGNVNNNPLDKTHSLWKLEKTETNGLIEDLIVTGYHSILVDQLSEEEQAEQKKLNFEQSFDNKHLLLACVSKEFKQLQDNKVYNYYHFILENDGDDDKRFGVYANGILSETPSKKLFLKKYSEHHISLV